MAELRTIVPFHGRANIVGRADIHASMHELLGRAGDIHPDQEKIFGKMRVDTAVKYKTPAPRNSFAFGEVMALGTPELGAYGSGSGQEEPRVQVGDIVGFDLHQTGHELDASPYYERADSFYTLPWKEIACRFRDGRKEPEPVCRWLMVEPDDIMTQRLVFGTSAGGGIHLPGVSKGRGAATNSNTNTKVRLVAGKLLAMGWRAKELVREGLSKGDWCLFNPIDAIDIRLGGGRRGLGRMRTFLKLDDLEQAVRGDGR